LFQAVTGALPYDAETLPELIARILEGTPQNPQRVRPEIPSALSRLISRAMARNRDQRISSLEVLIHELEQFSSLALRTPKLPGAQRSDATSEKSGTFTPVSVACARRSRGLRSWAVAALVSSGIAIASATLWRAAAPPRAAGATQSTRRALSAATVRALAAREPAAAAPAPPAAVPAAPAPDSAVHGVGVERVSTTKPETSSTLSGRRRAVRKISIVTRVEAVQPADQTPGLERATPYVPDAVAMPATDDKPLSRTDGYRAGKPVRADF